MHHRKDYTLHTILFLSIMCCWWLLPESAYAAAANGGMPWEGPLDKVLNSITGPVARAAGVMSMVIFGLGMAFSEGGGLRVILGIVFGLSIAFAATTWGIQFFGYAQGATLY